MKKIKFRGKEIKSNKYVYGFFIRCIDDCVIVTSEGLKTVYPDSVAQFVGYDKNGNEFYEDDEVRIYDLDGSSKNYTGKRFKIYEIGAEFSNIELVTGDD